VGAARERWRGLPVSAFLHLDKQSPERLTSCQRVRAGPAAVPLTGKENEETGTVSGLQFLRLDSFWARFLPPPTPNRLPLKRSDKRPVVTLSQKEDQDSSLAVHHVH
jgi:hypothetical protein